MSQSAHDLKSLRISLHQEGKKLAAQDDFIGALQKLKLAVTTYGPHLTLLADLAACYYMIRDYEKFQESVDILEIEYRQQCGCVGEDTQIQVAHSLGMFFEELGGYSRALAIYKLALEKARDHQSRHFKVVMCQLLRLSAQFKQHLDVQKYYPLIEQIRFQNQRMDVDAQSALMHADLFLFGVTVAEQRLKNFLSANELRTSDRHLMIFDFIYECMMMDCEQQITLTFNKWVEYFEMSPLDKEIWTLYEQKVTRSKFYDIALDKTSNMSFGGSLKWLLLLLKLQNDENQSQQIRKKLFLLLNSVDAASRKLILKNDILADSQQMKRITISPEDSFIFCDGLAPLRLTGQLMQLLQLFIMKKSVSLEKAAEKLFEGELDEQNYERLRLMVVRANKKLRPIFSVKTVFSFRKTGIQLDPSLELYLKNESRL